LGRLDGCVALITGAARGQGAAEARLFAAEGARVIAADILDDDGAALAAELGGGARFLHLDVAEERDWTAAVATIRAEAGRLDVLVNNAGVLSFGSIRDTSLDEYLRVVRVNQVGVFLGMRAVIPIMAAQHAGAIVNISSTEGMGGMPGLVAYASSKWAVRGMTKVAALELGPLGIRVNSVHPGGVDTPMVPQALGVSDSSRWFAGVPLGRIGTPDEVAKLVAFLASAESSYCTGAEFVADGGMIAGITVSGVG